MKNISRRDFLKGAASGVLSAAVVSAIPAAAMAEGETPEAKNDPFHYSWLDAPAPITDFDETVDLTGQFLVIGAGMSGYAVAARLVELGNKVTMIAKTDSWTGIGGSVFAFNSSLAKSLGGEAGVEKTRHR